MRLARKLGSLLLAGAAMGTMACGDGGGQPTGVGGAAQGGAAQGGEGAGGDAGAGGEPYPLGGAECNTTSQESVGALSYTQHIIDPSCVDDRTVAVPDILHVVKVPDAVTRPQLWVHLVGSGGRPQNAQNILRAAALEGVRAIGLAYDNSSSVESRCTDEQTGMSRPTECEELVRGEVVWGEDLTPWVEVGPYDGVVFRLRRLLEYLHAQRPEEGWDAYFGPDGEPAWDQIGMSGFSQGGGHVGLIARDRALARVMYLSKGAGSVSNEQVSPGSAPACDTNTPCVMGFCCDPNQGGCAPPPPSGGVCLWQVPVPWAVTGRDVDGDRIGDGNASTRATPASHSFALVHRDEGAWSYSPDVFDGWGMTAFGGFVDADSSAPPYMNTHLLSTGLEPDGMNCSEHQSMGNDACQPKVGMGVPAMLEAWRYMMSTPTP